MNTTNEQNSALPPLVNTYATYPFELASAKGSYVYDTAGKAYLDLYGGHCVCLTGHSHPVVLQAIKQQMDKLFFYSNAAPIGIRDEAASRLLAFAGAGMGSVFFCNSGSEANENALKAAVLLTGRSKFLAFTGAFHGRTLLALSVTDSGKLTAPYKQLLAPADLVEFNSIEALEQVDFTGYAAAIVEPVQSMAGVRVADKAWLKLLKEKCESAGTLLIFDEVQTGMGRMGAPFAANLLGVEPDMISLAKSIASGFPMGAVMFNKTVAGKIKLGDLGSTFGGGPVACAALIATLDVLEQANLVAGAKQHGAAIAEGVLGTTIRSVCGEGLLLGLHCGEHAVALKKHLLDQGILVGGSNDPEVLRLMPALTITTNEVARLIDAINAFDTQSQGAGE